MADEVEIKEDGTIIEAAPPVETLSKEDLSQEEETSLKSEDHSDDEQGHADETDEERAARTERNRARRAENKQRRKDYVESLKREIAARDDLLQQAMQRLDAVERRTQGADMMAVEQELKKAGDAYNYFKQQHAEAVSNSNGQLAAEAQEKMFAAMRRAEQLDTIRKAAQRQQANPAPAPLDPRLKMHAEVWLERNSWYDPNGGDMDSRITRTIDDELAREGWNPATEQYWEELDARVKRYLPHRVNQGYNRSQSNLGTSKPRVPVAGSGRETSATSGGYKLSSERVQALKDAGIWDDPKARADAVKRFQEYDKQQGVR